MSEQTCCPKCGAKLGSESSCWVHYVCGTSVRTRVASSPEYADKEWNNLGYVSESDQCIRTQLAAEREQREVAEEALSKASTDLFLEVFDVQPADCHRCPVFQSCLDKSQCEDNCAEAIKGYYLAEAALERQGER